MDGNAGTPLDQNQQQATSDVPLSSGAIADITAFGEALVGDRPMNRVEVLSNRLVPGSDGSIEHVVLTNSAVTIIRSTPLKGRVKVSSDTAYVGGVSCQVLLTGLSARVDTVRHIVGGESPVYGALFLARQKKSEVSKFGSITIGSPRAVIQALMEAHCETPPSPHLKALAKELDGVFLPFDKLEAKAS